MTSTAQTTGTSNAFAPRKSQNLEKEKELVLTDNLEIITGISSEALEKVQECLCTNLTWKRGIFCPVKTSGDPLKIEMKSWMTTGCESPYQWKKGFFSCSKKERMSGRERKNACRPGWVGAGQKCIFQVRRKGFCRICPCMEKLCLLGYNIFASLSFLLKINKYFSPFSFILLLSAEECWIKQIRWPKWQSTDFCSCSVRWGSSFWSSYQLLCLEAFVLLNKYIIKMQSIFVLHLLLVLKANRHPMDNRKSSDSSFPISFHFFSHYTSTKLSPRMFQ